MGFRGTQWSKTQYYRRTRKAAKLGCSIYDLPDGRGKHGHNVRGSRHHRWAGGTIISSHGYKKVRVGADHPLADSNGYAYEHLLVWVSSGNPKPQDGQIIHHVNGDKLDNRTGNLVVMPNEAHLIGHVRGKLGSMHLRPGQNHELPGYGVVQEWPEP